MLLQWVVAVHRQGSGPIVHATSARQKSNPTGSRRGDGVAILLSVAVTTADCVTGTSLLAAPPQNTVLAANYRRRRWVWGRLRKP